MLICLSDILFPRGLEWLEFKTHIEERASLRSYRVVVKLIKHLGKLQRGN